MRPKVGEANSAPDLVLYRLGQLLMNPGSTRGGEPGTRPGTGGVQGSAFGAAGGMVVRIGAMT